jgi:hypothetical protein
MKGIYESWVYIDLNNTSHSEHFQKQDKLKLEALNIFFILIVQKIWLDINAGGT